MTGRESDETKIWFEYVQTTGRFSAWPVRWQGWAALIALIVGPLALGAVVSRTFPQVPSMIVILGVLALSFGTAFPLAYFKGRPAKRSGV